MNKREDLLAGLKKGISLEEDFIIRLAPRCRLCISATDLSPGEKQKIESTIATIEKDSTKHKKMVENVIDKLKQGNQDV